MQLQGEREFQAAVIEYAKACGWEVFAVLDTREHARRTLKGWPDLAMWRESEHDGKPRWLFRELKSERGHLTVDQYMVLDALRRAGFDAGCWWPLDWEEIERVLGNG